MYAVMRGTTGCNTAILGGPRGGRIKQANRNEAVGGSATEYLPNKGSWTRWMVRGDGCCLCRWLYNSTVVSEVLCWLFIGCEKGGWKSRCLHDRN